MVVSPCTTFTFPEKVACFCLLRMTSDAASIWIGWLRFCEKPCNALGTPCTALLALAPDAAPNTSATDTTQAQSAKCPDELREGEEDDGIGVISTLWICHRATASPGLEDRLRPVQAACSPPTRRSAGYRHPDGQGS